LGSSKNPGWFSDMVHAHIQYKNTDNRHTIQI
jgi:hypothetical protein